MAISFELDNGGVKTYRTSYGMNSYGQSMQRATIRANAVENGKASRP